MRSEFRTAVMFGVGIAAVIGIMTVVLSSFDTGFEPATMQDGTVSLDKSGLRMAPDLAGIAHYLNASQDELEDMMKGKVVLYDIWTYSCINCIRTLPHITAWDEKYSDEGLLIIGIHSPEFEFEKDLRNVQMAVEKHNITYPVVMDNDMETWKAFENRYWPRKYVADHEGYIRYNHIGEGAYQETEKVIQRLLIERAASLGMQAVHAKPLVSIEEFQHTSLRTPELYFGYKFAQGRNHLGSEEGFRPGQTVTYSKPDDIHPHFFYPEGTWKNTPDNMQLISDTGTVTLQYTAKQVNIVSGNAAEIEIYLDGSPLPADYAGTDITGTNTLAASEPGLYNIIETDASSTHVLELKITGKGFEMFTFTFG